MQTEVIILSSGDLMVEIIKPPLRWMHPRYRFFHRDSLLVQCKGRFVVFVRYAEEVISVLERSGFQADADFLRVLLYA